MTAADLFALLWPYALLLALVTAEPNTHAITAEIDRAGGAQARAQLEEAKRLARLITEGTHQP